MAQPIHPESEIGITVGLVDALISLTIILGSRDLTSPEVVEALTSLKSRREFKAIMTALSKIPV